MIILRQKEFANKANKLANRQRLINEEIKHNEKMLNNIGNDIINYQNAGADTSRLTEQYNQVEKSLGRLKENVGIGAGRIESGNSIYNRNHGASRDLNNYVLGKDAGYSRGESYIRNDEKKALMNIRKQKDKFQTKEGFDAARETIRDSADERRSALLDQRKREIGKSRDAQNDAIRNQREIARGGEGKYITDSKTGKTRYTVETTKGTTESRIANLTDKQKARLETLKQQRRAAEKVVSPTAVPPTQPVTPPTIQSVPVQPVQPPTIPTPQKSMETKVLQTPDIVTQPKTTAPPRNPNSMPKPQPGKFNYGKAGMYAGGALAAAGLTYAGVKAYQHHKNKQQA